MRRADLHPLLVLPFEALSRQFGVAPEDMWAYVERRRRAPRWLVNALVETFEPGLSDDDFDIDETLPSVPNGATIGTQMHVEPIVGAKPTPHPFTRALRKRGMTVTEWADAHGLTRAAVKAWFLPAPSGRKIPRSMVRIIEAELKVPATAWRNGIREDVPPEK